MNWKLENRFEKAYIRSMKGIVKQMKQAVIGIDDPFEITRKLKALSQSRAYRQYCEHLSYTMVTNVNKHIKGRWRKAVRENGRGRDIWETLAEELSGSIGVAISEQAEINAGIIVTLPYHISREITDYIATETFSGRRSSEIAKEIVHNFPKKTLARSQLIARTEVSKTQCALIKARAESLGVDWYIWRTSKDARVRTSHEIMDGVLVKWNNPPNPEALDPKKENQIRNSYHAGNIYNCRCYPEPVINMDTLKFPRKVHYNGRIKSMTKSEFSKIM